MAPARQHRISSLSKNAYTVDGVEVELNNLFDEFWKYAAERHAIYERRRSGEAEPWSTQAVFRNHKFCNVYRVLDRHCQYLVREVIEKGSQNPAELVFRVALFDCFTSITTWELLVRELGELTWKDWTDRKPEYQRVLRKAYTAGRPLYTGSFQKPSPKLKHKQAFLNHLDFIEVLMDNNLPKVLQGCEYMSDAYEYLASFPGMGSFNAYQLLLNLSYTSVLNFSEMDFVILGPGSKAGIARFFRGGKPPSNLDQEAFVRWMCNTQDEHFRRLNLEFNGLGPDRLPLRLPDVEHTLCELDKYCRVAFPSRATPAGGKRYLKSAHFNPTNDTYIQQTCLPKAWQHPDRLKARIREEPVEVVKMYVVEKIMAERIEDGKKEYHVLWLGYARADATWEPAEIVKEDAPLIVNEYESSQG